MLCPESPDAVLVQNETKEEEETVRRNKTRKVPVEGAISLELNSYKNPKTWKKSITNFFRHSLRSTRSNDFWHAIVTKQTGTLIKRKKTDFNLQLIWFSHGCRCRNWTTLKWDQSGSTSFQIEKESSKSVHPVQISEGDEPSGSNNNFEEKDISPDQKWQSLGKMFRRQSLAEHWSKSSSQGESSSQNKRLAVKKVLSSYFGKAQKSLPVADEK